MLLKNRIQGFFYTLLWNNELPETERFLLVRSKTIGIKRMCSYSENRTHLLLHTEEINIVSSLGINIKLFK